MIHTSFSAPPWPEQPPVFHLSLVGSEDIQKFREILGRALNCAPEFGVAWFELADKLDQFLAVPDLPIPSPKNKVVATGMQMKGHLIELKTDPAVLKQLLQK